MNILYVEDDPLLRRHVLHELMRANHDVVEACNGVEACWLLNYHGSDLDMVITDIDLGSDLDGWIVAEHARQLSRGIGVVYATGIHSNGEQMDHSVVLRKPFTVSALENAMAEANALTSVRH